MQSNHFSNPASSFMLSIAEIPWLRKSFNGFLGFLYYNNTIYHFATYRHSKLQLEVSESDLVNIRIGNRNNTFIIQAKPAKTALLMAPAEGSMDRRIPESIDALIKLTMLDKKGNIVFTDSTKIAGLEMVGEYKRLQGLLK
jgi:hypothetical protein